MPKVDTNSVVLSYARETVHGTAVTDPASHRRLEPNDISDFAAQITTTPRTPISDKLQRQKGTPTDLDAPVAFPADITMGTIIEFLEAATFAKWQLATVRDLPIASVTADTNNDNSVDAGEFQFTLDTALVAAQNGYLLNDALVWVRGMGNDQNNGLHQLRAVTGVTAMVLVEAGDLANNGDRTVAETAAPAGAVMSFAGYAIPAAAGRVWDWDATTSKGTLTLDAAVITALKAGLKKGMKVHFGSVQQTDEEIQNGLWTAADAHTPGFARYTGDSTMTTLVFDQVVSALQTDIAIDATNRIDVVYGDFLQNVPVSDDAYSDVAYTIAQGSPNLFGPAAAESGLEYATGAKLGPLTLNFPVTDKATFTAAFTGRDIEPPAEGSIGALADPVLNNILNTTSDFARLRMEADGEGIETDFTSLTVTIDPQISPEKVLGQFGARYMNRGNLLVNIEAEVIFASDLIPRVIRDNTTAIFDLVVANGDGVLAIGVPGMTVGGGGRTYAANESVKISATGESFEDEDFGVSVLASFLPVPIPTS